MRIGHIDHLHNHYRVVGANGLAQNGAARLDALAKTHLSDALFAAYQQAFAGDETVYVLRQVRTRLSLLIDREKSDAHLAARWAEQLTGGIARTIYHQPSDGDNLVRFSNHAAFITSFIADLLAGNAQQRWFYFPLSHYYAADLAESLANVLLDNQAVLPAILETLYHQKMLDDCLSALDAITIQKIWMHGFGGQVSPTPAALRPLFHAAWRLATHLDLWQRPLPPAESLFLAYVHSAPAPVNWQEKRGLSVAVLAIISFWQKQRQITWPRQIDLSALNDLLLELDWLDTDWLRQSLRAQSERVAHFPTDLPLRPINHRLTPRQQQLLRDLATAVSLQQTLLDGQTPDSAANAIRLYTTLMAQTPAWAGDPLVTTMIQRVLAAWKWISRAPDAALRSLNQGNLDKALAQFPGANAAQIKPHLRLFAAADQVGLDLIAAFNATPKKGANARRAHQEPVAENQVLSQCAGVFLLLRVLLDMRLPWLVQQQTWQPATSTLSQLHAWLMALALRWAGKDGSHNHLLDAGVGILSGQAEHPEWESLQSVWSLAAADDLAPFQHALLRILAGQRLLDGSVMHICHLPREDGAVALVAADNSAQIFPLGCIVTEPDAVLHIVNTWRTIWAAATGIEPTLIAADEIMPLMPNSDVMPVSTADDHGMARYEACQQALTAADLVLAHGKLGLPDVDLTIMLTAVSLISAWSRWLRQFSTSSTPFLLSNFIRRPGWIRESEQSILVELEPLPLDIILEMSGYLADIEPLPWLEQRRVQYRIRGTS